MDSFYGAPRQPPKLPTINQVQCNPVVPEVSVIENPRLPPLRTFKPCDSPPPRPRNVLNFDKSELCKKQVRFQRPQELLACKENAPQTLRSVPDLKGKTFKQIYMANVPDRHLDLSILEPQRQDTNLKTNDLLELHKRISLPVVYEKEKTDFVRPNKCVEICTQTDQRCTEIVARDDEPTIKDLYRIIQQQNEQIMLLQQQVNNLKSNIPEIEPRPILNELNSPSNKGRFTFDVRATSYEVSFRPQNKFRKQNEFLEPKIQEISDNVDCSLQLQESLDLKESYVSNVQSIAIEMENYPSSDSDEEESQIGLSFYEDLMCQLNNILKQSKKQSECQTSKNPDAMKIVKQTTLQHLKNIGVNLSPIQESSEATESHSTDVSSPSEISCAVQQLLMKYLPPDKLANVVNKPQKSKKLKPGTGEFSFATLQYMKKYNLIDAIGCEKKLQEPKPRILNMTALKMQPKLINKQ